MKAKTIFYLIFTAIILCASCKNKTAPKDLAMNFDPERIKNKENLTKKELITPDFKNYWYAGKAEISSYKLEQARYGEIHQGHAVLIYVTENFNPEIQVKADYQSLKNIPILKLNSTKKFNTGIYPYSIMQSTFYPVSNNKNAIKVSSSIQEWCGHVYTQLNNKAQFEILSHSYFENEADQNFKINKAILENELWTMLRINPKTLPIGNLQIIPSLGFIQLRHKRIRPYNALVTLTNGNYTINYPELNRVVSIKFNPKFPYDILSWEESFNSGSKILTTKATKLKTIRSPYWQKNSNKDEILRNTLQLK